MAVEPSWQMIDQRPSGTRTVRGVGERLPVRDGAFDVAMAILTVHHWSHPVGGLREMRRVSARQVVFFYESLETHRFWALDYFPTALDLPTEQDPPGEDLLRSVLDVRSVEVVPIPHDCIDGFGAAFWRRPEAYADPQIQAGMSWLAMLSDDDRRRGSERLLADLASGRWDERYGHLRAQEVFDGGYRIAVAGASA